MITLRPSQERGGADHGWLKTRHTFSFNTYHDPEHMHFRALRVINEDWVAPGQGFGTHPHDNMEIITYVLEGALEHKDSLGTGSVIRPGDAQRMSAGTGIRHSEYNASKTDQVHMLQIWIMPNQRGVAPGYEQKTFPPAEKQGKLLRIAQGGGPGGPGLGEPPPTPVAIHADADLYVSQLKSGEKVTHTLAPSRHAWLQVTKGSVQLNGTQLSQGDGASASDEPELEIEASADAEVLLFDLA
jgi:redox-sensitive bicupin YhaK (pirin superfamily)